MCVVCFQIHQYLVTEGQEEGKQNINSNCSFGDHGSLYNSKIFLSSLVCSDPASLTILKAGGSKEVYFSCLSSVHMLGWKTKLEQDLALSSPRNSMPQQKEEPTPSQVKEGWSTEWRKSSSQESCWDGAGATACPASPHQGVSSLI